ncbi:MAG TPA: DHH family phosphoesterase [Clostridia bacterium]
MTDIPGEQPDFILERIAQALCKISANGGRIDILPHVRADGDAVGSALAIARTVEQLGGSARVIVDEPLDWTLRNLPGAEKIYIGMPKGPAGGDPADLAVMLDCGETTRLAGRASLYENAGIGIVLDHHISSQPSGGLRLIDPSAAAVGQIVYRLILRMEAIAGHALLSHAHAVCLMGAILTDTGGFRFSNTTRETFMVASALMQYDVDISALSFELLESMTLGKYRLIGEACRKAAFFHDGSVAILCVSQEMLKESGADENDTNGLANMLRAIDSVRVAFVIRNAEDGVIRVNVRSKEGFDSARFSSGFGGGGHARAAGFNLDGTDLDCAAAMLAAKAGEWLTKA